MNKGYCLLYDIVSLKDRTLLHLVSVRIIFVFHQQILNGNLLNIFAKNDCFDKKIKFRFRKTFCVSLNLNLPGERKNYGNGSFP